MLFKRKNKTFVIPNQTLAIWSPSGYNTTKISWTVANDIAKYNSTVLVELPCSGIPRLAVESGIMDKTKHSDAAILEYERKNDSPINYSHRVNDNLICLPANPYALPDHPTVHKINNIETLTSFPGFFLQEARKYGYNIIIFDCQGSLVSPMTFFTLKLAQKIILVVERASDIAWAVLNKERLIDTYQIKETAFLATTLADTQYHEEIREVLNCPVLPPDKIKLELLKNINDNQSTQEVAATTEQGGNIL